ncbi:hypothetical protein, partial [Planctopirus hydrillae]|uniref:hypothetical protein n=1 Tax=Planctopirus hydrillae TaxID=1841610 RepID=UPI00197B8F8F
VHEIKERIAELQAILPADIQLKVILRFHQAQPVFGRICRSMDEARSSVWNGLSLNVCVLAARLFSE